MTPTDVVGAVACPCGAVAGVSCKTRGGHDRPPHGTRVRAAEAFYERWAS